MYSRPSVSTEPDLCDQGRGKATLYISPDLEAECTIRWEWGDNLLSGIGWYSNSRTGGTELTGLTGGTKGKITITINGCNVKACPDLHFSIGKEECKLNVSISLFSVTLFTSERDARYLISSDVNLLLMLFPT